MRTPNLVTSFVLFLAVLLAADLALDYRGARREAARDLTERVGGVTAAVESEIGRLAALTDTLLAELRAAHRAGRFDPGAPATANVLLRGLLHLHPAVTSVNTGRGDGRGYLLLAQDGLWRNRLRAAGTPGQVHWYRVEADGTPVAEQLRQDPYDPRSRPWYQAALDTEELCWTGPYVMRTTRDPGLSASLRLTPPGHPNPEVAGADILLRDLGRALGQGLPPEAHAYLLTDTGRVVASSDPVAFRRTLEGDSPELPPSGDPRFQPLGALWQRRAEAAQAPLEIDSAQGLQLAGFAPIRLPGREAPFTLAVLVPSGSRLAAFRQESIETALLFLAVLALAAGLFARRYLVPIRRLTQAAEHLDERGEVPPPPAPRGDEVGSLEEAFHGAWQRLADQRQKLATSDRRYRELFEEAPILYGITRGVDGVAVIADCNRAFHEALGHPKAAVVGRPLTDFYTPASRHELETTGYRAAKEGRFTEAERTLVRADGSELHTLVRAVQDVGAGGSTAGIRVAYVDITALRQAEQARVRLADELRQSQKLESLGRLAGGVAHDFNNLLQVINGRCELLCDPPPADPRLARELAEIAAAGHRAADLTRQLLAFGRKQVLSPRPVTLNEVVEPMLPLLRRLLPEDVELDARHQPDPWQTTADSSQLGQVLMNLVLNARDALPDGGRVQISTENRAQATPGNTAPAPWVCLRVEDNGTGMAPEVLARVFEPFYTTKELGRGTGLGLSVVQGIVEQSGGHLQVRSQPGAGTTFEVWMPRREAAAALPAATAEPATAAPHAPQHATLLLVEDEPLVAEVVRQILGGAGYHLLVAASEAEALQAAAAHPDPIDLLVSDVVLPGGSGVHLAQQLGELRPGLRVLFISGYPGEETARRGLDTSGGGFLQKPFGRAALLAKVEEVLGGGEAGRLGS